MEIKKVSDNITFSDNIIETKKRTDKKEENLSELLSNPIEKNISENKKIDEKDKSQNEKFDISEALFNFGKGIISPISVLIKHPILSVAIISGTVYACLLAPVLAPILTAVFGGISLYQIGGGVYNAVQNYNSGNYDDAEKSFDTIGQGVIGTILSALSLKPSAKVVRESKLLAEGEKITPEIAPQLLKSGFLTNLKEIGSLLTTKTGIKAMTSQLKPSAIKTRFKQGVYKDIVRTEKGKTVQKEEKIRRTLSKKELIAKFQQSAEGIRRAKMTDEQIKKEAVTMLDKIFDKFGTPKNQRPLVEITNDTNMIAGSYNQRSHTLEFSAEAYKSGITEMENVLAHEATHCREALLRKGIPQKRVDEIITKKLLEKAKNGEVEEYVVGEDMLGAKLKKVPKMSPQMKEDFYQIIKNPSEYKRINGYRFYDEELAEELLNKYPEFISQYKNREAAFTELCHYMYSFEKRFKAYTDTSVTKNWIDKNYYRHTEKVDIPELTGQSLKEAEQSLIDMIDTWEGNARISGVNGFFAGKNGFDHYQFSPEEVLAQKEGNGYLIESLTEKLKNPNLQPEEQTRLQTLITQAKAIIDYKIKGQTYYKKYIEHVKNPENAELAEEVESLEMQLFYLKEKAFPRKEITETKIVEYNEPNFVFAEQAIAPIPLVYKFLED